MWNGFIGQRIAATAKTLQRTSVSLGVLAVVLAIYGGLTLSRNNRDDFIGVGFFVVCLGAGSLWALILAKRRIEMPERHPLCKALAQYGPLYLIVPQIDADFAASNAKLGSTTFTPHWVISCWTTQSYVLRREEIVWIYKKQTTHSVNLIPTGSSCDLVLRDSRGKIVEISASEQDIDMYLSALAQQTPWVSFGYDKKLEKLYKKQLTSFVQSVAQRRAEMEVR